MKLIYSLLLFVFLTVHAHAGLNMMQKIFVHGMKEKNKTIELANIICNFQREQHVDIIKTVKESNGLQTTVYFLPMATLGPDIKLKETVAELTTVLAGVCTVRITQETKPIAGVKFEFKYNQQHIDIMYNSFSAINLKKGIVFRIYNKRLLNHLQKKYDDQSLLTLALHTKLPTVIIDCGHGGDDYGAVGYNNIKEKDINLSIGLTVAQQLKKKGVRALLTRTTDTTLSLKDRVIFANNLKADLFVSIHSNAAFNTNASGVETFGVTPLFEPTSPLSQEKTYTLMNKIVQHRVDQSMGCAAAIQNSLISHIQKMNYQVKDRAVKRAPLLVLLGTTMPSVLVEVGFVSNQEEALLLSNGVYQDYLAHGITQGIVNYLNPVA